MAGCDGSLTHRDVAAVTGSIPLEGRTRIGVAMEAASFRVVPGSGAAVTYQGLVRRAANSQQELDMLLSVPSELVAVEADGGHLRLTAPGLPAGVDPREVVFAHELELKVPPGLSVEIEVRSGTLEAREFPGPINLRTQRGDLRLLSCGGAANLRTGIGVTIVHRHRGDLVVDAGSGDMQVFMDELGEHLRLSTGLGNIACYLHDDTGFRIDARTMKGKIFSAFGMEARVVQDFGAVMTGAHGDGTTEIVMRSGGGRLAVNRQPFK